MQRALWSIFLLLLTASGAAAGVVLEQQAKDVTTGEVIRMTTYVEPGRLRMEVESRAGTSITIFRADRQVVWMIQSQEGTYQEMTQSDVERMAEQLTTLRKQQEEMLKGLPPEQRAVVEEMLKQQVGGGKHVEVSVRAVGQESVGNFSTTKYEILADGQRTAELWAAPLTQLSLHPEEHETFVQFARFFEKLSQTAGAQAGSGDLFTRYAGSIEGFPVKILSYDEGELVSEQLVVRAQRQAIAGDKFELPAGLRKVEMAGPELEP